MALQVLPAIVVLGPQFPIGVGPAQTFVAHKTCRQITSLFLLADAVLR
jgi:hypothetical protein